MVPRQFQSQSACCGNRGRWGNADDASYVDLNYFLPDAPCVDVIITTWSSRAQGMTALEAVKVGDMNPVEAAELFRTIAKQGHTRLEVEKEVMLIAQELG
jgi:hypothetical protein